MIEKLLICSDLDRTLIANGPQPESPAARNYFTTLVKRPEVVLVYVSGRHRELVMQAIEHFDLPQPNFVIGDVGTTIYQLNSRQDWQLEKYWEQLIARDWGGKTHDHLHELLADIAALQLQQAAKQNTYKLSYYIPLQQDCAALDAQIQQRLVHAGVSTRLIWSVDEAADTRLLDIIPSSASKYHAIESLMRMQHFDYDNTVFCGDSGNDLDVLASPIRSVLVANSALEVQQQAQAMAQANGHRGQLYIARGGFAGMNGNYSAGMLEGIAHYYPQTREWMGLEQ